MQTECQTPHKAALLEAHARLVDPDQVLPEEQRYHLAEASLSQYMRELSRRGAVTRARWAALAKAAEREIAALRSTGGAS
jgi:hypothetical protein